MPQTLTARWPHLLDATGSGLRTAHEQQRRSTLVRVALTGLGMLALFFVPSWQADQTAGSHVALHTALELMPITIATAIFAIGWEATQHRRPRPLMILAAGFLGVAALDGLHLLSDPGMPGALAANSNELSARFWLAGRVLTLLALAVVAVEQWDTTSEPSARFVWTSGALVLALGLATVAVAGPEHWSRLVDEGGNATGFRVGCETAVVASFAALGFALWHRTQPAGTLDLTRLAAAAWVLGMSEALLANLSFENHLVHFSGHVFRGIGYGLLYSAVIREGIRAPWARVRASEQHLETLVREKGAILDNVNVGVCFVRDGRYHLVNRAFEQMFGCAASELLDQPLDTIVPRGEASPLGLSSLASLLASRGESSGGVALTNRAGRHMMVQVSGRPLDATEPARGSIWCLEDITERMSAEAHLEEALIDANQHARSLEEINQTSEWLLAAHDESEAFRIIARAAERLFATRGYVGVARGQTHALEVACSWGEWGTQLPRPFPREACWALRLHQAHAVVPGDGRMPCTHVDHPSVNGSLCVPLSAETQGLGLLFLERPDGPEAALGSWRRQVDTFAATIRSALANLRLRQVLHDQATHDALTGLCNRRTLDETLPRELHRAQRSQEPLTVAMLDLDHFKKLNDTHGHAAGDVALETVARLLEENLRFSDLACRFGGEEFVVVLPNSTAAQARVRLDAVRHRIANHDFRHLGHSVGPLTVSVGLAEAPRHGQSSEELLREADRALYAAKDAGRNCTRVVDDVEETRPAC